jgi:uncharacterized protein
VIELPKSFKLIFKCKAGSHLYGTNTPLSDVDYRGVFIPDERYFYGCMLSTEQFEDKKNDETYFEIRKFMHLALDNNPNIVELLFVPQNMWEVATYEWQLICNHKKLFLSKKAKYTFLGYAHSQFKRIRTHRNWLLYPPAKKPEPEDYGLIRKTLMSDDDLGAYEALKDQVSLVEDLMRIVTKNKAYKNAQREWDNYESWKKNRNPERAKLEEKFGYDTKHAAHLIRLISEGEELLLHGTITFPRPDAEYLLKIRAGELSYDQLYRELEIYEEKFEMYYETSPLPHKADVNKVDELCIKINKAYLRKDERNGESS